MISWRSGRLLAICLLALGLGLALHREAPAEGENLFVRLDLKVGGRITEVLTPDFDGDGKLDLLVIRGREALVFFQRNGSFPRHPNQRFRFHPRTILFDVGDIDGDGKAEILLVQQRGVYVYRLSKRRGRLLYGLRPEKLVECESFFSRPVKKEVRRKQFLRDVDADGDLDLLLPQRNGFWVLANEGGKFGAPQVLHAPPTAMLHLGRARLSSQLFASYWFPNPNVTQWDAKGSPEIVLARDGEVMVFDAPKAGALPVRRKLSFVIPDQHRFSMQVEKPLELDFTQPLLVRDLNHDGRVDVSATHVGSGTTSIYLNRGNGAASFVKPASSVRVQGITLLAFYVDMDGDGRDDLMLPRMDEIGAWAILKVLITRTVPLEMLMFYQRDDGLYPDEPDDSRDLELPIEINFGERVKIGTTIIATLDGDYDGDGVRDLLYRTDSDELSVYRGSKNRVLDEDAFETVEVPDADDYRFCLPTIADLNGDGCDDVVLHYFSWDRKSDAVTVLLTRKGR